MKILLLGPNGQLGSDIQRENTKRRRPFDILPIARAELDVEDVDKCAAVLGSCGFDVLINCTSYHKTDEVEQNAQRAFSLNAHAVGRLAEICSDKKARLVHISTDYVFGGYVNAKPLLESDAKAPINVYGASKAMGEDLALASTSDILIARVASLFGIAGASGKGGNFVETMLRLGREKGAVSVVADQHMSPTSTEDAANIILNAIEEAIPAGVYHVVNSGSTTWWGLASRVFERSALKVSTKQISSHEFPTQAKRPSYSVLSNHKISNILGKPRSWEDALDAYLIAKGHRRTSASRTNLVGA